MSEQRISVAVRIRPTIERERYEPVCARKADDDQTIIIKSEESSATLGGTSSYQFDYAFDESDDQAAVYEESVQEMVDHALSGFNATVFTYGQTGSGKTYTILGAMSPDGKVDAKSGMFLRVFDDIFTYKESVKSRMHIIVTLSALELYVEEVMDLLSNKKKLKLRETPDETLTLGISTVEVRTMADVVRNFEIANSFRSVTATKMNDTSSRSHALFFIDLFQVPVEKCPQCPQLAQLMDENGLVVASRIPGLVKSRIALVDLAGSERVKKSGVTGQGMTEAQAINKSLSTLGTVINAMYVQNPHIPFRESKLTKLLKPCFVETTSRLLLIGQVAPPSGSASESLGTLRFCDRVKGLKAGQVAGFADPAEEEAFLKSLRAAEEISADLRIAGTECYFEAVNVHALAQVKGTPLDQEIQRVKAEMQAGAADVAERKEREAVQKMEAEAAQARDRQVEEFVLHMNSLIEEYELVARSVKKEKKEAKKRQEELEAEHEARLHETKKVKKMRVKLEERLAEQQLELSNADGELQDLEVAIAAVRDGPDEGDDVNANSASGAVMMEEGPVEEATHALVESFFNHATEQNRLYSMYVSRIAATARERAQVRRMKLMSSSIVTEGTLLYDLIAFLVDRAVDIAEGDCQPGTRWGWYDVDGLSQRLLNGEEMYPPMIPAEFGVLDADSRPCEEQPHTRTFLSSDESDSENSHHAAETRRIRQIRDANYLSQGGAAMAAGEEDPTDTSSDAASEDEGAAPVARSAAWMDGQLAGNTPPPVAPLPVNEEPSAEEVERQRLERKAARKAEKKAAKEAAAAAAAAAAATAAAAAQADEEGSDTGSSGSSEAEKEQDEVETPKKDKKKKNSKTNRNRSADQSALPEQHDKTEEERSVEALMRVYDSPKLVDDLLSFLRGGSKMLKHGRHGKPHMRLFWVSASRGKKEMLWMEPDNPKSERSSIALEEVSYIQLGCFGKVFRRHPMPLSDPAFFRCFTVGMARGGRTVDIVAETVPDFEAWVVGLAHLIGVDPCWGGKLDVAREPGIERLTYYESQLCESHYIRPLQYLELKRRVQQLATRTLQVLQECNNDAAKAHAILKGIHPPAINEKGALLLTKGELRFLIPDVFDIFRVSHVWMVFQKMNLVYDDDFMPATAFGITQRDARKH